MKPKLHAWRSILFLAVIIAIPNSIKADAVSDWNAIAVQATITGGRPSPTNVLDIAMVHAAIYDAVQAIERKFEPYYVEINGASGSPIAAAAKAAHDVLVNRFPAPEQANLIHTTYVRYLMDHGLSETDPGVEVGAKAAAGIIALRACDGSFPVPAPPPFTGGTGAGVWRPTPPGNQPMTAPWLGLVTPFVLTRPSQFRSAPPPDLASRQYARDYEEVKTVGALNSSVRTPEQTDMAHFFAGNTPVIWNRTLREVSDAHNDNIADSSRLFALASMAIADTLIAVWNAKTHYVFWRPITAIREGDNDGNPLTAGDAAWVSLITTPSYPDYTSGANGFASAVTHTLEHFFGTDHMTFSLTTTNVGPTVEDTRMYQRFSDVRADVVDARVYSGIHFRFADVAARKLGKEVADWTFKNFLRPVNGNPKN
jgi:hypothetical protein